MAVAQPLKLDEMFVISSPTPIVKILLKKLDESMADVSNVSLQFNTHETVSLKEFDDLPLDKKSKCVFATSESVAMVPIPDSNFYDRENDTPCVLTARAATGAVLEVKKVTKGKLLVNRVQVTNTDKLNLIHKIFEVTFTCLKTSDVVKQAEDSPMLCPSVKHSGNLRILELPMWFSHALAVVLQESYRLHLASTVANDATRPVVVDSAVLILNESRHLKFLKVVLHPASDIMAKRCESCKCSKQTHLLIWACGEMSLSATSLPKRCSAHGRIDSGVCCYDMQAKMTCSCKHRSTKIPVFTSTKKLFESACMLASYHQSKHADEETLFQVIELKNSLEQDLCNILPKEESSTQSSADFDIKIVSSLSKLRRRHKKGVVSSIHKTLPPKLGFLVSLLS
jgi:hypothetical protein